MDDQEEFHDVPSVLGHVVGDAANVMADIWFWLGMEKRIILLGKIPYKLFAYKSSQKKQTATFHCQMVPLKLY